jgi:hypothetical protein
LKLGVAGYSLRLFSLDAAIGAIRRLGLSYASLSNAHVPLGRPADALEFRRAQIP